MACEAQRIIEREEILRLEPNTNPEVVCALLEPMSGLTSPYELTCALADHAAVNGAEFRMNTRVEKIEKTENGFRLTTNQGVFEAELIVNCAGVHSAELHNQLVRKEAEYHRPQGGVLSAGSPTAPPV